MREEEVGGGGHVGSARSPVIIRGKWRHGGAVASLPEGHRFDPGIPPAVQKTRGDELGALNSPRVRASGNMLVCLSVRPCGHLPTLDGLECRKWMNG